MASVEIGGRLDLGSLLLGASCFVIAAVSVYDVNRAIYPRLAGEARWRFGRAAATLIGFFAFALIQLVELRWLKHLLELEFLLACAAVLLCSLHLFRLFKPGGQG